MELTDQELWERGIRRNREEVAEEAGHMALAVLAGLPTGRGMVEPARELSPQEAEALEEGGADLSSPRPQEHDPLAHTAARYGAMLASAYTTSEAARLLGVGQGRIRQRLGAGTLYGVKAGRENRLPAFQFEGGGEVPHVGEVLKYVDRSSHPVAILNWFTMANADLYLDEEEERPLSPRQWLLSGGDPEILKALAQEL